jgi:hypothetical protein
MMAVASTPNRKYFSIASFDRESCLRHPASRYVGIEIVSSATKMVTRSRLEHMTIIPSSAVRVRK